MNSDIEDEINWRDIRPLARRGIHSEGDESGPKTITMGRFGLNTNHNKEKQLPCTSQQGVDEIDNVISKMARASSPVLIRKQNLGRRNSVDTVNNDSSEEESDICLLSKSTPASFLHYSDDLYASSQQEAQNVSNLSSTLKLNTSPRKDNVRNFNNSRNDSQQFNNSRNNSQNLNTSRNNSQNLNNSRNNSRILNNSRNNSRILNNSRHNSQYLNSSTNKSQTGTFSYLIGIVFGIIGIIGYLIYNQYLNMPIKVHQVYDKFSFYNDLMKLESKYDIKDNSILQVRTGIATIFENQDTGSFIFTYNNKDSNFNPMNFNRLIEDLAATASRYLRNESKELHVVVETSNLMVHSVKEFMDHYKAGVDRAGVMLVKDIDNVPSELAMAFHYYCDEYNPLVKRSAIFFTLNLANCSQESNYKTTHAFIENCLMKKWTAVGEDKIRPLLARVVNVVVDVTGTN